MPYIPRHQKQLGQGVPVPGKAQGSRDCGPRSWSMGVDARSKGRKRPSVRLLRHRGGVPGPQPTSIDDAHRALHGMIIPGRTPLRYYRKAKATAVQHAVAAGKPVHLGIDYGTWNDVMKGDTGDPRFRGGHSVLVFGERRRGAGIEWLLFDPLDDGRRKGIPRGSRWVLRKHVMAAAKALTPGRVHAGVIGGAHARS